MSDLILASTDFFASSGESLYIVMGLNKCKLAEKLTLPVYYKFKPIPPFSLIPNSGIKSYLC